LRKTQTVHLSEANGANLRMHAKWSPRRKAKPRSLFMRTGVGKRRCGHRSHIALGRIGHAVPRLLMISGFDCWATVPALGAATIILTDLGNTCSTSCACFGEAARFTARRTKHCQMSKARTSRLCFSPWGAHQAVLKWAMRKRLEKDFFPQTFGFVEGPQGSIEVTGITGYEQHQKGTQSRRQTPLAPLGQSPIRCGSQACSMSS
jgi:hypothetical protein